MIVSVSCPQSAVHWAASLLSANLRYRACILYFMWIYTYIYICVYTYIYVYIYTYVYIHYYCTPPVCVPAVLGALAVRRQNNKKKI